MPHTADTLHLNLNMFRGGIIHNYSLLLGVNEVK